MNDKEWKLSNCNCYESLKNFKCDHIISIASIKKLVSFDCILLNLPLEPKKRRGRRKIRKTALQFDEKEEEHFISDDELQIEEYNLITTAPELTVISKPNAIIKPKAAIKPKAV